MIEKGTLCYLFKATKDGSKKIYHRTHPKNFVQGDERWNTPVKEEAGMFTKEQWKHRSTKWAYNQGWMLESINAEVEAL